MGSHMTTLFPNEFCGHLSHDLAYELCSFHMVWVNCDTLSRSLSSNIARPAFHSGF